MLVSAGKIRMEYVRAAGRFSALRETDLTLREGRLSVLEGRSGSGKTTLLNILAGLQKPSSGEVLYDGTSLYSMGDDELSRFRNDRCGIVPQGQSAVSSLTVLENVMLPGTIYGLDEGLRDRAESLLEKVGIADLKDVMPSEMSGGEIRRMAIARALLLEPEILLADEPTADLDPENTAVVLSLLREAARGGTSVLIVTHDADAAACADRMFQMDRGRLTETAAR